MARHGGIQRGVIRRFWGILLLVLFLGGCGYRTNPRASNGVLNLSSWHFTTDGVVKLDGTWEFYWKRLFTPSDFAHRSMPPSGLIQVPGVWNGYRLGGTPLPGQGYATYRLRVRFRHPEGPMGIYIRYEETAYRLWVDGRLVAGNGRVGTGGAKVVPQFLPETAYFQPQGDSVQIVLQVANSDFRNGGVFNSLYLGTASRISAWEWQRVAWSMFLIGGMLVLGLYHLLLNHLRRETRSALHFGLLCLILALRSLVTGDRFLIQMMPALPWQVAIRIEYLTDYLGFPALFGFLYALYPWEVSRKALWTTRGIAALGALFTLLAPVRMSSVAILPYEVVLVGFLVYALVTLVRAAIRRRQGAALLLAGTAIFVGAIVNDLLYDNGVLPTGQIIPFGLFVLIFFHAVVVAERTSGIVTELQQSRRMLTEREEGLRRDIAEMLHGPIQTRLLLAGHRIRQAEGILATDPAEALSLVAAAREDVDHVREEDVRRASHRLHPTIIRIGLLPAVRSLLERFEDRFATCLDVDPRISELDDSLENRIPEPVRLAVYRILEEGLANIAAHAGAGQVEVRLSIIPGDRLLLVLQDDGRGVESPRQQGLGLRAIAARVAEMGGEWDLRGKQGCGTTLTVRLPLA